MFKKILKYIVLWFVGAFIYGGLEIIFKGSTHISMGIIGGICLILIGNINQLFGFEIPLLRQMLYGAIIITCFEFATGVLVNIWLALNVWDYSEVPLNYEGQVCLSFSIVWYFISGLAVIVDDYTRYLIFKEPKPTKYCFFISNKSLNVWNTNK